MDIIAGYYLFAEATGYDEGDIARLYSPHVNITTEHCLSLHYSFYGRDIDTFTIFKYLGNNIVKTLGKSKRFSDPVFYYFDIKDILVYL